MADAGEPDELRLRPPLHEVVGLALLQRAAVRRARGQQQRGHHRYRRDDALVAIGPAMAELLHERRVHVLVVRRETLGGVEAPHLADGAFAARAASG